jgi:hypothetical protein
VREEHADWDAAAGAWQAPRGLSIVTYREDGKVSGRESQNPDGSVAHWARLYDDGGRLVEAQFWMDDGPRTRELYSYDAQGRRTAAVRVEPDGTEQRVETCDYDGTGRRTKVSILPAAPRPDIAMAYGVEGSEHGYGVPGAVTLTTAYDDGDLPTEGVFHDASGAVVRRIVFSRDDRGHVLSEVMYFGGEVPFPDALADAGDTPIEEPEQLRALMKMVFADQVFSSIDYAYDEKGRLLEKTRRMGVLSEDRTTFEYNDHDDPISEIQSTRHRSMGLEEGAPRTKEEPPRGQHNRYEYQYDSHGNWTERVIWLAAESEAEFRRSVVYRRTMTYYEP